MYINLYRRHEIWSLRVNTMTCRLVITTCRVGDELTLCLYVWANIQNISTHSNSVILVKTHNKLALAKWIKWGNEDKFDFLSTSDRNFKRVWLINADSRIYTVANTYGTLRFSFYLPTYIPRPWRNADIFCLRKRKLNSILTRISCSQHVAIIYRSLGMRCLSSRRGGGVQNLYYLTAHLIWSKPVLRFPFMLIRKQGPCSLINCCVVDQVKKTT